MRQTSVHSRAGRSIWTLVAFLTSFTLVLIGICYVYLFPALEALKTATPAEKIRLRATATLLEAVLLLILFSGLVLTVRFGRFFFPKPDSKRTPTKYVDAWAEAGKRMSTEDAKSFGQDEGDGH